MSDVTRVTIAKKGVGIIFEETGVTVELAYQDDGRTLKVFIEDMPADEATLARARHHANLAASLESAHKRYIERRNRDHPQAQQG